MEFDSYLYLGWYIFLGGMALWLSYLAIEHNNGLAGKGAVVFQVMAILSNWEHLGSGFYQLVISSLATAAGNTVDQASDIQTLTAAGLTAAMTLFWFLSPFIFWLVFDLSLGAFKKRDAVAD